MSGFSRVFHKNKNITKSCDSFSELFNKQKKLLKSGPVANSQEVSISKVAPLAYNLPKKTKPNSRKVNEGDLSKIHSYLNQAVRDSSRKNYKSYWTKFKAFCSDKNLAVSSAEHVIIFSLYLPYRVLCELW